MTHPEPINCRAVREMLTDEVERSRRHVQSHLEGCAECRAEAARLTVAWTALGLLADREPSPHFTERVLAELDRDRTRSWLGRLSYVTPYGLRWAALASAAAAIVLVVSLALNREPTVTPPDSAGIIAELEVVESQELLQNLEVVDDLDLLLLMDEG